MIFCTFNFTLEFYSLYEVEFLQFITLNYIHVDLISPVDRVILNIEGCSHGLRPLHTYINSMILLLEVAEKMEIKTHRAAEDEPSRVRLRTVSLIYFFK